jgi:hypothetical protein
MRVRLGSEEGGGAEVVDVLEDTTGDELPILRPDREAGSKPRGDKDYEDGGDAEVEEGVFVLNASAQIFVAHFGEQ